jgi:hypothetical protein
MKKLLLSSIVIILSVSSYAQQRDTTLRRKENDKQRMTRFIGQRLGVDSVKAKQIGAIQEEYKAGMGRLNTNTTLTETQRHQAVDSLMRRKNAKLSTLLTPEQQAKIIPSTERRKAQGPEKKN